MLTCIHSEKGLCVDCQMEYDADPSAWEDYGHHTQGVRNWEKLRTEMNNQPPPQYNDYNEDDIPF